MNHQAYFWDLPRLPQFQLNPGTQAQASIARLSSMFLKKTALIPWRLERGCETPVGRDIPGLILTYHILLSILEGSIVGFLRYAFWGWSKNSLLQNMVFCPKYGLLPERWSFEARDVLFIGYLNLGVYQVQGIYIHNYIIVNKNCIWGVGLFNNEVHTHTLRFYNQIYGWKNWNTWKTVWFFLRLEMTLDQYTPKSISLSVWL